MSTFDAWQSADLLRVRCSVCSVTFTVVMYKSHISLSHVQDALKRIKPHIHETPVLTSATVDELCGRNIYFKAECFQKVGAFKARGACNAVLSLLQRNPNVKGVVTHSSGNHGQGVSYAAKVVGIPCVVVVPEGTAAVKANAIKGYGAELVYCGPTQSGRDSGCQKVATERGYEIIHPYDNYDVMAGQGTCALEFLKQVPQLDAILTPISGGGLASGVLIATKGIKPECKVFVVEPAGKDLQKCISAKERLWPNPPQMVQTVEGLKTQQVGNLTFPVVCDLAEPTVFTVTNEEMHAAQKFCMERMKVVIEGAGACTFAAVLSESFKLLDPKLKNVGIILSGGNMSVNEKLL